MSNDDILKNVTRELKLIYYNNYLLKVGAITKHQHSEIYLLILNRTSTLKKVIPRKSGGT